VVTLQHGLPPHHSALLPQPRQAHAQILPQVGESYTVTKSVICLRFYLLYSVFMQKLSAVSVFCTCEIARLDLIPGIFLTLSAFRHKPLYIYIDKLFVGNTQINSDFVSCFIGLMMQLLTSRIRFSSKFSTKTSSNTFR
jgi:hypothetical protein